MLIWEILICSYCSDFCSNLSKREGAHLRLHPLPTCARHAPNTTTNPFLPHPNTTFYTLLQLFLFFTSFTFQYILLQHSFRFDSFSAYQPTSRYSILQPLHLHSNTAFYHSLLNPIAHYSRIQRPIPPSIHLHSATIPCNISQHSIANSVP